MERRLIAGLLVLVLSGSVILAYAAPPPKITLEDIYTKLIEIEGKLWSYDDSVKKDLTTIRAKLELLELLTPQRISSLDTVPKIVTRAGSVTFPAGTQDYIQVLRVQDGGTYDKSLDISLTVCTGTSEDMEMWVHVLLAGGGMGVAYYWTGLDLSGCHIMHFAATGFILSYVFPTALTDDVHAHYAYTVTTTAGVQVVETIG